MAVKILQRPKRTPVEYPRLRGRKLQSLRKQIFESANYRCAQCGRITIHLELDHKIPIADGGTEDEDNLQPLCAEPCHREKTLKERTAR